ncbi:MAG TPA: ABC transporter permease subunit, partial [Gaiellaceae bacterium]
MSAFAPLASSPFVDEETLRLSEIAAVGHRRRRATSIIFSWRAILLAVLLVGWYYASGRLVDSLFVSNPVRVFDAFRSDFSTGHLGYQLRFTALELVLGYLLGAGGGILAAVLLSLSTTLERSLRPYFMVLYAMPTIALAPLFVIWFGFGLTPKVIVAALFVFFIVFVMTLTGLRSVEPGLIGVARVMGATRRQLL